MKFSISKTLKGTVILALLDLVLIWIWVKNEDLNGAAMYLYILVPFVFILNIIIGAVLFFAKRAYSGMFFINCIVASVITSWLFTSEMTKQANAAYDIWVFDLQDTTFRVSKSNKSNNFNMSYSFHPGSSWSFMDGHYEQRRDTLLLTADSIKMFIHHGKLYNFRRLKPPIVLKIYDPERN
ncbi:hypothetical protein [Pedobacter sp. MC2016-24]|uniref:hypothetical protein n=1 Tax=Pedobacter sp. MC2016-24 TaxID=2780090 RepID=UPI0018800164|nr:hypothetical protein [Pedobacter sp. MC2016-24]MBE9603153.1 hypothetical protein [Pedobacter sp. MC2016-24]